MERRFDEELKTLKERLLVMGSVAEAMIHKSIQALVDRDETLIQKVYEHEEEMDQLCIEIDDRCFGLLALRQPMASDLRLIVGGIKINGELERIGDLAVNIGRAASSLMTQPFVKPLIDIPRMASLCQEMVKKSLDAFVTRDPELSRMVIEADDQIDALRDQVFRELLTYMTADPSTTPRALELILISRYLERIADHATNIAEDVIYIVRGEDVRERGDKEIRKGLRRPEAVSRPLGEVRSEGVIPRPLFEQEESLSLFRAAAQNAVAAAKALRVMLDEGGDFRAHWHRIEDMEHEGDRITHQIMRRLDQTFITFIDRRDLHALASALDDVVDGIEAATSRMVLYRIEQVTPEAKELARLIVQATEQVWRAMTRLPRFADLEEICIEINRLENTSDEVYRKALTGLFHRESPPLEIMKWKEIYEILEGAVDRCEDVSDVVEGIALKHT